MSTEPLTFRIREHCVRVVPHDRGFSWSVTAGPAVAHGSEAYFRLEASIEEELGRRAAS